MGETVARMWGVVWGGVRMDVVWGVNGCGCKNRVCRKMLQKKKFVYTLEKNRIGGAGVRLRRW